MQIEVILNNLLFHAPKIDGTGAAVSAVNCVALVKEELDEVGSVLSYDADNDCFFHRCGFRLI